MKSKKILFLALFIFAFALSIALFIFQDFFAQAKSLGLIGIFLINAISNASFFIAGPGFISVIASGSIYPPILVALVASLGSATGDMLSFIVGLSGRNIINHKLSNKIWFKVLDDYFKKYGGWLLFIFALVPNPLFDSIGIFAGAFAYSPWKFFIIVFVGRLLRFFLLASLGASF